MLTALFGYIALVFLGLVQGAFAHDVHSKCTGRSDRYAMVIGNSGYSTFADSITTLEPLPKVKRDGIDMASALCDLGFSVDLGQDQSLSEMSRSVAKLERRVPEYKVRLFYYSGHALQKDGENFLVPIGARISSGRDIERYSINLGQVYEALQDANNQQLPQNTNIIILDACRNSRFNSAAGLLPGLAIPSDAPASTLVAFATAPGTKALSTIPGTDLLHSPYTDALLSYVRQPGLSLPDLFAAVRTTVLTRTHNVQIPWENSSTLGTIYLAEPVHIEWKVDTVDDVVEIKVADLPVVETTNPTDWVMTPFSSLKPGRNRFEIRVYNDKTYRNQVALFGHREGWKYSVRMRIAGNAERLFTCGEETPPEDRWGKVFTVQTGFIDVDPMSGDIRVDHTGCLASLGMQQVSSKPEWQAGIDWCMQDTGTVECPDSYVASGNRGCLSSGRRSCLLSKASALAKQHACTSAFELAVMCQCHNPPAGMVIRAAGASAVCNYLATKP